MRRTCAFQISLLHGRQLTINNHKVDMLLFDLSAELFNLTAAQERCWSNCIKGDDIRRHNIEVYCRREAYSFFKPLGGGPALIHSPF